MVRQLPSWQFLSAMGVAMVLLDLIYFQFITPMWRSMVKGIQGHSMKLRLAPAVLVYAVMVLMASYFPTNATDAFLLGAGVYAVFDLTSYALFTKWSIPVSIVDIVWGGILFSTSRAIAQRIV